MIRPLRHIDDFLDLARANAPDAAAARACSEGNYTQPVRVVLPDKRHGWRFTVIGQSGSKWSFSIIVDESRRRYVTKGIKVK